MHHMLIACGTERGPQLNFENLDSKKVASAVGPYLRYIV